MMLNVLRFLRDTGFRAAVTTAYGNRHVLNDALNWDRVRISGQLRLQDFARLLDINVVPRRAITQPTTTPVTMLLPRAPVESVTPNVAQAALMLRLLHPSALKCRP
jgi:hypothetical protein